jgi:hypothetical protein
MRFRVSPHPGYDSFGRRAMLRIDGLGVSSDEGSKGMTESVAPPAAKAASGPSRKRIILARTLTVIGVLLVFISVLANYVKREALDESRFRSTSRALVSDETIRNQVASALVDQLYANTDIAANVKQKLPDNLQPLAVPIAGLVQNATESAAKQLLARPRVQDLFVEAASRAQQLFVAVLDGDTQRLETTDGKVVLDLHPILVRLGDRFNIVANQIPPESGRITILEKDQLKTAQKGTRALRFVANWIWVLALLAWAGAILLVKGRRRLEVRAIGIGILAAGFLILVVQGLVERYFVNRLVEADSVKPAAKNAFEIITDLLRGAGWTAVIIGVVALFGVWLVGPGARAAQLRAALAPHLSGGGIYGATIGGYLLLLWWRPTPQFGFWVNVIIFFAFLMLGTEVLRRKLAREATAAQAA